MVTRRKGVRILRDVGGGILNVTLDEGAAAATVLKDHILEQENFVAQIGVLILEALIHALEGGFLCLQIFNAALLADTAFVGSLAIASPEECFLVRVGRRVVGRGEGRVDERGRSTTFVREPRGDCF